VCAYVVHYVPAAVTPEAHNDRFWFGNQLAFTGMSRGNRLTGGPRWLASTCSTANMSQAAAAAAAVKGSIRAGYIDYGVPAAAAADAREADCDSFWWEPACVHGHVQRKQADRRAQVVG
jgi:hypothetical protein